MKQILQNIRTGETYLEEVPEPSISKGKLLIKTSRSLVSLGTEKMLVEFGKASLIEKARKNPEKVELVLNKLKKDGILPTLKSVFTKLELPIPLGYCNVGTVIDIGKDVSDFQIGDRVVSNGPHAEVVCVPKNLVARIPDLVSDDEASFTVVGSIGLQGIRLLRPQFGETIVVYGLGLIGLITCQLLKSNGCNVIGIDIDKNKCDLATSYGVHAINALNQNIANEVLNNTDGFGADGVIITASSKSNEIMSNSTKISRKRGRIILVGVIDLTLDRSDFYEKELTFQVSCSYGPGRYDNYYEEQGIDYPLPYVRWTEKRNFVAILNALQNKHIKTSSLISKRVKLEDFKEIYEKINSRKIVASIISYDGFRIERNKKQYTKHNNFFRTNGKNTVIGIIGSGNYASMTLLPALHKINAQIKGIASQNGLSSNFLAKKYKISYSTSDYKKLLNDKDINLIIIATRHDLHSKLIIDCLKMGKNTFVEKPLAINSEQLESIKTVLKEYPNANLTVGFNRRFSPHVNKVKSLISNGKMPINITATMNAGYIAKDHWVHDLKVGGGRIIGEACHLIDLCLFLSGSQIRDVCAHKMGAEPDQKSDDVSILLNFTNGSNAVVNYFSNGSLKYSKERIEVYSNNQTFVIDDFKRTFGYGNKIFKKIKTGYDKGHIAQFSYLIEELKHDEYLFASIEDIINVTEVSFAALDSLKNRKWISLIK